MKLKFSVTIGLSLVSIFSQASVAAAWDYQSIRDLIENNPSMRHIDELLPKLDSELLSNYLLIYASSSLQQSSLNSPRVILRNNDASFIMAFNGSPKLGGYNRLEMIQFDKSKNRFDFFEAHFPETNEGDSKVVFSEKNPEECQSCHRSDLRPNWEAYPFWQGAYGSISGSATARVDMFPEAKLFKEFQLEVDQKPRYRHLIDVKTQTVDDMANRNLNFNRSVASLNFRRIVEYLKGTPDFDKYKFAFTGAVRNCPVEEFIPSAIRSSFDHPLDYYENEARLTDARIQEARRPFISLPSMTFYRPAIIGALRYLLEGRHVPPGSWSMVLGEESFNMSTGKNGVEELGSILGNMLPELQSLGCGELKTKSLAALQTHEE